MVHEGRTRYLSQVGEQIRWRRARKALLEELGCHIDDQARDFRAAGVPEDEAMARAVAEMGDPVEVGRELDRLHRPKTQWEMVILIAVLLVAGLMAQNFLLIEGGERFHRFRQLAGVGVGCVLFLTAWLADYTLLFRRWWMPFLCLAALIAASFASFASYTSIPIYLSLLFPVAYGAVLCRLQGRGWLTVLLCALAALALPFPALLAPRLSAALAASMAMLLVLGASVGMGWFSCKKPLGFLCAWGVPGGLAALYFLSLCRNSSYAAQRWLAFLHPELDPRGAGWLFLQLRGGMDPEFQYLFNMDLMLSELSHRGGPGGWTFLLTALVFLLFAVLVLHRIARLRSVSGKLVALGALWPLLLQAVLFVAYNLGWSPLSPLSLPFLSYGFGFMTVNLPLAGVILSVLRMDALARDGASVPRRWKGFALALLGGRLRISYQAQSPAD